MLLRYIDEVLYHDFFIRLTRFCCTVNRSFYLEGRFELECIALRYLVIKQIR